MFYIDIDVDIDIYIDIDIDQHVWNIYIYVCTAVIISLYNQQSHGDMSHHVPAT